MKIQFNIQTVLVITTVVSILVAWWTERTKLHARIDAVQQELTQQETKEDQLLLLLEQTKRFHEKKLRVYERKFFEFKDIRKRMSEERANLTAEVQRLDTALHSTTTGGKSD